MPYDFGFFLYFILVQESKYLDISKQNLSIAGEQNSHRLFA